MHASTNTARSGGIRSLFRRGEAWLDQRGTWAWITLMVLLFVIAWPVALVLLAYMIWEKRMFTRSGSSCRTTGVETSGNEASGNDWASHAFHAAKTTGNYAFDRYKAEALRRLEDEQAAFEAFLQRLRNSKDKSEFDSFMDDRARATASQDAADDSVNEDVASGTDTPPAAKPGADARPGEY